MFNAIIVYAMAQNAERILKSAEKALRRNWNIYGFKRVGSGYSTITTDGFGNPYPGERELKVFGIAIEVPENMDYRTAMAYLNYGARVANCHAEFHYTNI